MSNLENANINIDFPSQTNFPIAGRKDRFNNSLCVFFTIIIFVLPFLLTIFYFFNVSEKGVVFISGEYIWDPIASCVGVFGFVIYTFLICSGTKFLLLERIFGISKLMKYHRWVYLIVGVIILLLVFVVLFNISCGTYYFSIFFALC
jgi:hypothetical protein